MSEQSVRIIEGATRDDVRPGDHISWEWHRERSGVTIVTRREGIAHHRDEEGDWRTAEGEWLTKGEGVALTIRRPVREMPTEQGTVIVAMQEGEYIEAEVDGETWRAREAALDSVGDWIGAWRSGDRVIAYVTSESINPDTWKTEGNQ